MNDLERLKNAEAAPVITNAAPFDLASAATDAAPQNTNTADSATSEAHGKATKTAADASADGSKAKPKRKTQSSTSSQFKCGNDGVWFRADEESPPVWVCARLDVLEQTRDETGGNWGKLVKFADPDGTLKELNLLNTDLAAEGGAVVIKQLADAGLRIGSGDRSRGYLLRYLREQDPTGRALLVDKAGWHGGDVFLLGEEQIGEAEERRVFAAGAGRAPAPYSHKGSVDEWRQQVSSLCAGNPLLLFATSAAFAGPLLELIGAESGGFHVYGNSSQGKSTLLSMAASVWGKPADYSKTWRATDNALEGIARAYADTLLPLDEIAQCEPRIIDQAVYLLGNSKAKSRATDTGGLRKAASWRLLFLSAGEVTLQQHLASVGKQGFAGLEMRLLSLPLPDRGLFDELHGLADGAALSNQIKAITGKHYGSAGRAFLHALVQHKSGLAAEIRSTQDAFISQLVPGGAHGQVSRAAARFALAGIGGELATRWGVTGWAAGAAMAAAGDCFRVWLRGRGTAGSTEELGYIKRLASFLELHGSGRFTRLTEDKTSDDDNHKGKTLSRVGYRWLQRAGDVPEGSGAPVVGEPGHSLNDDGAKWVYYIFSEAWAKEIYAGLNFRQANKVLLQLGVLSPGSGGKASKSRNEARLPNVEIPGRVYVVDGLRLADVMGDLDD
jgi:putative DNA primase/helicase